MALANLLKHSMNVSRCRSCRTPKNNAWKGWEPPSYEEKDIFGNKTPIAGNKRRRLDTADPLGSVSSPSYPNYYALAMIPFRLPSSCNSTTQHPSRPHHLSLTSSKMDPFDSLPAEIRIKILGSIPSHATTARLIQAS